MSAADIQRTILAVWRIEQPRLITSLSKMLRDVPLAEDLTQEVLLAAIEHWPASGIPEKPGAWLMAAAKRRALDHLRAARCWRAARDRRARAGAGTRGHADLDSALDDDIGDELLRLIFTACHPLLSREARAALALRMICGLTTDEIARAFLVPEATIGQRIVRAKRTLSESGLSYETPRGNELSERLASVLEVVYLIFNEGYTASRGDDWQRPQLCNEALRIGRVLISIAPGEPETHGLLALMEMNASRIAARTDATGEPILLLEQNRALWDQLQIRRGMLALGKARELGGAGGFYALQAAIIACHAGAGRAEDTDWRRISALYAELAGLVRSPVIELNRAVAVGMAEGPQAALAIVDTLVHEPTLKSYHLLGSVRGDLLQKLGRYQEARAAFEAAAALAGNAREREFLKRRAAEAGSPSAKIPKRSDCCHVGAGARPPHIAHQRPGPVLIGRLCGSKPQHRQIVRLHFHAGRVLAAGEDLVNARQVVAGHVEQQMMFEMVIHIIGRDEQPLEKAGARGAGVAQRIAAVGHHSVFGDVADAGDHHLPGEQRHQPQQRIGPPYAGRRKSGEESALNTNCGPSLLQKCPARCFSGHDGSPSALSNCALRCAYPVWPLISRQNFRR